VPVPAAVAVAAGGREVMLVWANEAGGLTFTAGEGTGRCFIKWASSGSGLDLPAESGRLAWARRFHPVPQPLASGRDAARSWLVTAALPGKNAVGARWKADPAAAVTAIGRGLRALHEALPAAQCPFSWSAGQRLAADRWADLAVATWSAEWNYGPGWERPPLDAYGIRPDPGRTRYYRLLWDLSS
jgi:kanamycin kinase